MNENIKKLLKQLQIKGMTPAQETMIQKEMEVAETQEHRIAPEKPDIDPHSDIYGQGDQQVFLGISSPKLSYTLLLQSIDELLERDKQREEDGFPRKIRLGKLVKPSKDNKGQVVIVPTTTETKFFHDDSTSEEETTGGSGQEGVGDVIGEQQAQPQQGEGEGQGAGRGESAEHDIESKAFDLGKILTEKFQLPNLKDKGKKKSLQKYTYDLTDVNQGFGQILDKKATIKRIVETNIQLGRIHTNKDFAGEDLILNPEDKVYRILSKEQDYESQAIVFFLRDYSGSMQGKPTEVVTSQHLFIYSWLMYQYKNNVISRFILHDTEAREVEDFYTYYKSTVAGGTNVYPAYELLHRIVEEEQLAKDYNIYVFHGTDGDDWDNTGEKMLETLDKILPYVNRVGITVAKNNWGSYSDNTTVEKYMEDSGLLQERADIIRMDSMVAEKASENRIIESIKRLIE